MQDHLSPVEKILGRLEDYKERRGEFRTRCPAHQGNSDNSLSIKAGDDGRVLLVCRGGCSLQEILDALGLKMGDLFANSGSPEGSTAKKAVRNKRSHAGVGIPTSKDKDEEILATDDLPDGTYWEFTTPSGE